MEKLKVLGIYHFISAVCSLRSVSPFTKGGRGIWGIYFVNHQISGYSNNGGKYELPSFGTK